MWSKLFWRGNQEDKTTNLGEELRKILQSREFEQKFEAATPFLLSSLAAWPAYWLYRGLEWSHTRPIEALPLYIKKTFFQAKLIQLIIITTGILAAINHDAQHNVVEIHEAGHELIFRKKKPL